MREVGLLPYDIGLPDVISGNAAISASEKGLQGQRVLRVLAAMHQTAVMPDVISYNAAISACEKVPAYLLIHSYSVLVIRVSIENRPWVYWRRRS